MLLFIILLYSSLNKSLQCFNTSHVTLYRIPPPVLSLVNACFNTSHVTLYQSTIAGLLVIRLGFNTSHVTLYPKVAYPLAIPSQFQYISCYSLSVSPFVSANVLGRFNTSHVTLYRQNNKGNFLVMKFQYISCYSLSSGASVCLDHCQLFQYISCYSLSLSIIRINTSLFSVSIHLMLLFIPRFSNLFPANLLYNIAKHKGLQYFSQAA